MTKKGSNVGVRPSDEAVSILAVLVLRGALRLLK